MTVTVPPEPSAISRVFCSALPLAEGDRVAVIGWPAHAASAVREFGVAAIAVVASDARPEDAGGADVLVAEAPDRLPFADSSVDHVMVRALTPAARRVVPHEFARIVRPGGSVLVVCRTRRAIESELRSAGFTDIRSYGIRPTLYGARHLVPFDCPSALRWYVRSFVSAANFRSPFLSYAMRVVPQSHAILSLFPTRVLRALFPAVAFHGVRAGPPSPR